MRLNLRKTKMPGKHLKKLDDRSGNKRGSLRLGLRQSKGSNLKSKESLSGTKTS